MRIAHGTDNGNLDQRLRLRIETFGRFTIRYGDREVVLHGRKARALLGYLALVESGQETRERLVGLLWSEADEARARASLRQTLYEIREAFEAVGFDKFDADKHVAKIDRSMLDVDLWDVMQSAKRGEPHATLLERDRVTESLLQELEAVDPSFRSWLLAKRQSLHDRLVAHLEDVLRGQTNGTVSDNAERIARALMKLDPTHEEAARALIRARVTAGDMGGALGIYKTLWNLLEEEYDVEPSKETQELIAGVKLAQPFEVKAGNHGAKAQDVRAPAVNRARPQATKLILSVGSFDLAGTREAHHYLAQGFRRELMACLVRFREWVVRDEPIVCAGTAPPGRSIGEFIIDASAFETPNSLRLVLMLRDANKNEYLWSERIELAMANWFEAQQGVVRRIATALNVHLSLERLAAIVSKPAADLDAYDLWLQGQTLLAQLNPAAWKNGVDILRQVVEREPEFAPAYCGVANANNMIQLSLPGVFRDKPRTETAMSFAKTAVRLDPSSSRTQLCLAWSHAMSRQPIEAATYAELAYELNDNDPWTAMSTANCLALIGCHDRSLAIARQALDHGLIWTPVHWAFHATTCFMNSAYADAVAACDLAQGSYHVIPAWRAAALAHLERIEESSRDTERFLSIIRQRWVGAEPASDRAIARWFLQAHPICVQDDWDRLHRGLELAGLPVADIDYASSQ